VVEDVLNYKEVTPFQLSRPTRYGWKIY